MASDQRGATTGQDQGNDRIGSRAAFLAGGFILAGSLGWTAAGTIALLVLGVVAALALVRVERLVPLPMIPPELFRNHQFRSVVVVGGIYNFGFYGSLFCLSLLFHEQLGLSPFDTGLALLPPTAVIGVIAFASARLIALLGTLLAAGHGLPLHLPMAIVSAGFLVSVGLTLAGRRRA